MLLEIITLLLEINIIIEDRQNRKPNNQKFKVNFDGIITIMWSRLGDK